MRPHATKLDNFIYHHQQRAVMQLYIQQEIHCFPLQDQKNEFSRDL